jgi:putative transcriptional regulator
MPIVKVNRAKVKKALKDFDWSKIDAMTDEDIARQIASNPDTIHPDDIKEGDWIVVKPMKSAEIAVLRRRMKLSQARFAKKFGLRLRTIQEWEQGRRQPEEAARILLRVIEREPAAVERALAKGK